MTRLTKEIRKKMRLVGITHAALAFACVLLVFLSIQQNHERGVFSFSILLALNLVAVALIAFFWKRGFV